MEESNVPWRNVLAFGTDNANVMVGRHKGVFHYLLEKNKDMFLAGCSCHLIHHAAEKAAACFPFKIDEVLVETYCYLDKSSNRLQDLDVYQKVYDVEHQKILRHVGTRWLSIGRCLDRILENWEALKELFRDASAKEKNDDGTSRVSRMFKFYRSPTNYLYCLFLQTSIKIFDEPNTKLQAEAPQIHILRRTLHKLMRDLLIRLKASTGSGMARLSSP
jgi:hypothetical protein